MLLSYLLDGTTDVSTWTFGGTAWVKAMTSASAPHGRGELIYDAGRQRDVLLIEPVNGDAETWEWGGSSWKQASSPGWMSPWTSGAYSPELHATVLIDSGPINPPTRLYDGSSWRSIATAHTPSEAIVQYDQTRHSIVALSQLDYQTWLFDGKDWTSLPIQGPTPKVKTGVGRQFPAVAMDQQRGVWVLFAGFDGYTYFSDTWVGDGNTWTKVSTTTSPWGRVSSAMAWDPDRHRVLMFGGLSGHDSLSDTWSWDGKAWAHVAGRLPSPSPSPQSTPASGARISPPPVAESIMSQAYFNGLSPDGTGGLILVSAPSFTADTVKTWRWDGSRWHEIQTGSGPSPTFGGEFVLDVPRKRVIAYGDPNGTLSRSGQEETWSFDGGTWTQLTRVHHPPPMYMPSLAYDNQLQEIVLFGVTYDPRVQSSLILGEAETWAWNGADWVQLHPVASPPPHYDATMAFDQARGRLVLVGGRTSTSDSVTSTMTWMYDGKTWSSLDSSGPQGESISSAYDPISQHLLVFVPPGDTYARDGAAWSRLQIDPFPSARGLAKLVLDPVEGHVTALMIDHGGAVMWRWAGSSWTLVWPSEVGTWRHFVSPAGFSFDYPPFWYAFDDYGYVSNYNVGSPLASGLNAIFLPATTFGGACRAPPAGDVHSQSPTRLGGIAATRYRWTRRVSETTESIMVQAERSGTCFTLEFWSFSASALDSGAPLFDRIVASFSYQ
jgi:hypothetical protein